MLFRSGLPAARRFFFVKQKTAYEMRISDWSSDVCSSDLLEELVLLLVPDDARDTLRAEAAAKYPTATVAEIRFDDDWPSVTMASGTLTRFIRPRDLDPTLGPDQA